MHHTKNFSWQIVFASVAIFYLGLLLLTYFLSFKKQLLASNHVTESAGQHVSLRSALNFCAVLIALAIIAYVYIEYIVTYWFSPYLQISQHINVSVVGEMVGVFGIMMAIGRLAAGTVLLRFIKASHFIILSTIVVFLGFLLFLSATTITLHFISIAILGLGCSALFPTLLGYGIRQAKYPLPQVTSLFILCGSIGGGSSMILSATVGRHISKVTAIYFGPVIAILIILLIIMVMRFNRQST